MTRAALARALGALALALALAGCSRAERSDCGPGNDHPVDAPLVAFLGRARAAHHAADNAEQARDTARAVAALESLVKGPLPPRGVSAPEVREVLADTHARLADLKSQRGDSDAAKGEIALGLELAKDESYFRGHLFEVDGLIAEREAKGFEARGDGLAATAARARALTALEESMRIQAEVIRKAAASVEPPLRAAPPSAASGAPNNVVPPANSR